MLDEISTELRRRLPGRAAPGGVPRLLWRLLAVAALIPFLAACGGGGGGGGDSEPPPKVSIAGNAALEGGGANEMIVTARLSKPANGNVSVHYATESLGGALGYAAAGSSCAESGADYAAATGTIEISPGEGAAEIPVTVCGDSGFEPNERLTVTLTGVSANARLGGQTSATATILNDDAGGLSDTGITACDWFDGTAFQRDPECDVAAVQPGGDFHGQDAQRGRSARTVDYGKRFTPVGGGSSCVRDNVTGLVWALKTNGAGLRDKDWTYTWHDSSAANPGLANGGVCAGSECDTEAFVQAVNNRQLCGYSNWRLPTVQELTTLVNSGVTSGATIEAATFPNQVAAQYWTATVRTEDPTDAWVSDFANGAVGIADKSEAKHLRLVSGGAAAPPERYVVSADGRTVIDQLTGLMWKRCSAGATWNGTGCSTPKAFTWQEALAVAQAVNADPEGRGLGFDDWRLPNRNELASLVDRSHVDPAINTTAFPDTPSRSYWSSSPFAGNKKWAWYVEFDEGYVAPIPKLEERYVRLVRGGQ